MFKWSEWSVFEKAVLVASAVVVGVLGVVLAQWSPLAAGAVAAAVGVVMLARVLAPRTRVPEAVALSMVLALGVVATLVGSIKGQGPSPLDNCSAAHSGNTCMVGEVCVLFFCWDFRTRWPGDSDGGNRDYSDDPNCNPCAQRCGPPDSLDDLCPLAGQY